MCGITGFWGEFAQSDGAQHILEQMTASLAHRGPDGRSHWLGQDVGLGHSRLAIIDIEGGTQPLWSSNGRYVIVFNGEIYNYRELEKELVARNYLFKTRSDTEVIAAALDAWGIDEGLRKLRGMFAFALYDTKDQSLLLARDRVGIKPLYWAQTSQGLLFASEQKAILSTGLISRRINPVAIHDFLAQGYPTTPDTCWADIRLLEPGTWLQIGPKGVRKGSYWQWLPRDANGNSNLSIEKAAERTSEKLLDTLSCHLLSDVPLGVFLSGGLDSSLLVALLSKGLAPGIQTFTMGFGDPVYDESGAAKQIAALCKTQHHESRMNDAEADPDLFQRILNQYDEPFGDISCIPVYLICGEIRKHVKVVLSGDGGDEILGGYLRYLYARRLAHLAQFSGLLTLLSPTLRLVGKRMGSRGRRIAKAGHFAQMPREEMLCALHSSFLEDERRAMYQPEFAHLALSKGPTSDRFSALIPDSLTNPVEQLVAAEMRLRLHADYLRKVDIASSAHGLEVRVPYLDNEMLDFASGLPGHLKIDAAGKTKMISRRLVGSLLTAEIAARPKQGFDPPLDRWLGAETRGFLRDILLDKSANIANFVQPSFIAKVWRDFEDETSPNQISRGQRIQRVFLLSALELWLRRWNPSLN